MLARCAAHRGKDFAAGSPAAGIGAHNPSARRRALAGSGEVMLWRLIEATAVVVLGFLQVDMNEEPFEEV